MNVARMVCAPLGMLVVLLSAVAVRGDEPVELGPYLPHVWPIGGRAEQQAPITSTFGPRVIANEGYRHDFLRGIDISVPEGTEVKASAPGLVKIAGSHPAYQGLLVRLEHQKPAADDGAQRGVYYSQYMYLLDVSVKEGDQVEAGALLGHSGRSPNGFQYLRFDVRDGGTLQMYCVHPLSLLPYDNRRPPQIAITGVDRRDRTKLVVGVQIRLPAEELDLARVELDVFEGEELVDQKVFDLVEWNRLYTVRDSDEQPLDQETLNGLMIKPDHFRAGAAEYRLDLVFLELLPVKDYRKLLIKARAIDVGGKVGEAASRGR